MSTYKTSKSLGLGLIEGTRSLEMKKMLALFLVLSSTVVFAQRGRSGGYQTAGVQQQLLLELNEHSRGLETILLKQEIKAMYPHINLQDLTLDGVMLMAKSKHGQGEATLIVGQSASYPARIGGRPADFHVDSMRSFSRVQIPSPTRFSEGKWQIETKGNVKVKAVIVLVTETLQNQIETVVINMNQEHSRGEETLKLKQLIKQQAPQLELSEMELLKVTLVAKSRMGQGRATLNVGQSSNYPALIPGGQREFQSSAAYTFHRVEMKNSLDSRGAWQIDLKGNIKVSKIIVKLKGTQSHIPTRRSGRSGRRN